MEKVTGIGGVIDPTLETYTPGQLKELIFQAMHRLPSEDKRDVAVGATQQLSAQDQKSVREVVTPPVGRTRDAIWLLVVSAFSAVLVGSFIVLAIGLFNPVKEAVAKPELVLTMFTSAVGFLAGLFVPSPLAKKEGETT